MWILDPQKIPDDLLQNLTGLGKGNFGDYVAKLANAGIKKDCPRRILNLEQIHDHKISPLMHLITHTLQSI